VLPVNEGLFACFSCLTPALAADRKYIVPDGIIKDQGVVFYKLVTLRG